MTDEYCEGKNNQPMAGGNQRARGGNGDNNTFFSVPLLVNYIPLTPHSRKSQLYLGKANLGAKVGLLL